MLESLLKPTTKYAQRKWRKVQKDASAKTAQLCEQHPRLALDFKKVDLFNFAYHAVYIRNEKMLDDLWAEHEKLAAGDNTFRQHIAFNRACIRISEQKFEEAIQMLKALEAEGIFCHRNHVLFYLVEIYEKLGDFKSAAPYVHLYLEDWSRDVNSGKGYLNYANLGTMLHRLAMAGEFENVIRMGKERLALYPDSAFINFLVGQSYLSLKDELRALHYFTQALKLHPKYPEIYVNLGAFYWNERMDFPTAIDYMLKAAEACGDDPDYNKLLTKVYQNLANLYKIVHDLDNAGEYRRKQFEAMNSLAVFDLMVLFGSDMSEYQAWADNHPEVYEEFLGKEEEDEEDWDA